MVGYYWAINIVTFSLTFGNFPHTFPGIYIGLILKSFFKSSFSQGIQFLLENDLLQQTPEDIAQFLYKGEGLNKTVIGDYLGER